jgi:phosphate:Na+ symporter
MLAVGGLTMIWTNKPEKTTYQVGRLLVGFGLLFMGLDFMKSSIATLAEQFDVSPFAAYSPYLLFIVGFVLTAIIQSSSAAMVIALSALYAQVLSLEAAAAMVIGNDLGTTITVILGSIKGSAAKKRVALSHFLFNLIVDLIALALLPMLLLLLQEGLGISNPLLILVAFHSSFNLLGIFIFLPLLGPFARFLERRFQGNEAQVARYIHAVPVEVTEVALETLEREIRHLVQRVFVFHYQVLRLRWNNGPTDIAKTASVLDQYAQIKELEGELTAYQIALQNRQLQTEETEYLRQLTRAVRHAMAAAKTLKDISHNVTDFDRSIHDDLLALMAILQANQQAWYPQLYHIFERPPSAAHFEELVDLKNASKHNYALFRDRVYPLVQQKRLSDIQISTVFNLNREIHSANKSLVLAVKDLLLEHVQASDFETLPEPMS